MTKLWDDGSFYDPNFILLSIRAPFRTKNGYGWISENAANPTGDPDAVRRASARLGDERIIAAIDSFGDEYSVDDVETYVLGFAQAAPLAFYSAFKHPDVFAGVAVESGNLDSILNPPKSLRQAQYLDFYLSVGRDEDTNLVKSVRNTGEVLSGLGADVDVNVHDGGRVITWQSCRRMQNTFDLSNGEAPEDNFNAPGGGGLGPGEDDSSPFGGDETGLPGLPRLLAVAR
jgi:predicted esterase